MDIQISAERGNHDYPFIRVLSGKGSRYLQKFGDHMDTFKDGPRHCVLALRRERLTKFLAHARANGVSVEWGPGYGAGR